jgi:hypothetical protein
MIVKPTVTLVFLLGRRCRSGLIRQFLGHVRCNMCTSSKMTARISGSRLGATAAMPQTGVRRWNSPGVPSTGSSISCGSAYVGEGCQAAPGLTHDGAMVGAVYPLNTSKGMPPESEASARCHTSVK